MDGKASEAYWSRLDGSNVHLLGCRGDGRLSDSLRRIDVTVIRCFLDDSTRSRFSMKFFEYGARGQPVVTTLPNAIAVSGVVVRMQPRSKSSVKITMEFCQQRPSGGFAQVDCCAPGLGTGTRWHAPKHGTGIASEQPRLTGRSGSGPPRMWPLSAIKGVLDADNSILSGCCLHGKQYL